jgi:mRNA interferase MazF
MVRPVPLRGEVWDARLARVGEHPVVVLTINRLRDRIASVTVVLVTGTGGPRWTHIPLGPDAGLDRYAESYANVTDVHTIPTAACRRRRGLLAPPELTAVAEGLRITLGLDS